jgi:hypothetical protein
VETKNIFGAIGEGKLYLKKDSDAVKEIAFDKGITMNNNRGGMDCWIFRPNEAPWCVYCAVRKFTQFFADNFRMVDVTRTMTSAIPTNFGLPIKMTELTTALHNSKTFTGILSHFRTKNMLYP